MTTLGFQIKFGQTLSEDVSHISVQAELHKEKVIGWQLRFSSTMLTYQPK